LGAYAVYMMTRSGLRGQRAPSAALCNPTVPTKSPVVHSDPDILSGTPVFVGPRVPVQSQFDNLEGGDSLNEFLRQFPSVRREQAIAALELARESVVASASVLLDENSPHDLIP
jgi:uncharacterized protein (DUF433 family)